MEDLPLPRNTVEIIKNKLYFSSFDPPELNRQLLPWIPFTNDPSFIYTAFFADFGPFDLGITCKFCQMLHESIASAQSQSKAVIYFSGSHEQKRANAAVLLCAYLVFVLNYTVEQAYGPFIGISPPFITFRDAGFCINTYPITVLDTVKALYKAVSMNHFNYKSFSVQAFQNLAKLQNGDISWIIPGKFIAFSGPVAKRRQIAPGVFALTPEQYVPVLKNLGVSCIVRFNDKCYDRKVFTNGGIKHVDLYYEDGANPTENILQSFLQLCEQEKGAIAVHCKAGLGRTGTNIAAYMIKHYQYTAKETIAWCRICRPGSIVGPQQQYLSAMESKLLNEGHLYRENHPAKTFQNNDRSNQYDPEDPVRSSTPPINGRKSSNTSESLFKLNSSFKPALSIAATGSGNTQNENANSNLKRPKSGSTTKRDDNHAVTVANASSPSGLGTPRKQANSTAFKVDEPKSLLRVSKENDLATIPNLVVRRDSGTNGRVSNSTNSSISSKGDVSSKCSSPSAKVTCAAVKRNQTPYLTSAPSSPVSSNGSNMPKIERPLSATVKQNSPQNLQSSTIPRKQIVARL